MLPSQCSFEFLNLNLQKLFTLKYHKPSTFSPEPDNCFFNVCVQINQKGGNVQYGWIIGQDKSQGFAEARFHAVWRDEDETLIDVTPRSNGEKRIMFVSDSLRQITLSDHYGNPAILTYDNVRMWRGRLITGIERIKVVPDPEFLYKHGLAFKNANP